MNAKQRFESKFRKPSESTLKFSDFEVKRTLGTGSFGRVLLVKKNTNEPENDFLALKVLIAMKLRFLAISFHVLTGAGKGKSC